MFDTRGSETITRATPVVVEGRHGLVMVCRECGEPVAVDPVDGADIHVPTRMIVCGLGR
jgi:hypothetical protein